MFLVFTFPYSMNSKAVTVEYCCEVPKSKICSLNKHLLEELTLGSARVTHNTHVYVPPETSSLYRLLCHSPEQHQQNSFLDLIAT